MKMGIIILGILVAIIGITITLWNGFMTLNSNIWCATHQCNAQVQSIVSYLIVIVGVIISFIGLVLPESFLKNKK